MRMNHKKILAVGLAAVMTVGAAGSMTVSAADNETEKITFVLDWTPNTNHTGLYVAESLGYFEDQGLEVEIVQPPEGGADALVASGRAQFGVSFQDSMAPGVAGDNALPTTAVAALIQHNTSGIISRKGEGMDTPKGMEGKKYATWDGPIEVAMIQNVVEQDGGDFSKVEMIPSTVTDEVSALESGSVDAIWIFYAWAGVKFELTGAETDYFAFKDINPVFDYYTPVVIANNEFLEEEPETAKKFLTALRDGYEYAIENPQEAADILCEAAPELDPELVLASQEYLKDQYKAEVSQWGYIDPERWNAFYEWLNENGLTEAEIPENVGFSNDYLPE
ncbi:MAG TPA: ABC transporter substrate-binding protein [Candidatus Blautia excrementigallinarum]|nr:ABC transporter substrate-binding protein [Candidatus Blautia excrementigallinarum]